MTVRADGHESLTASDMPAGTDLTAADMSGMVAAMIALLMSIDPILDMFRTVVNVCGDSLCCLFLNDTDTDEENAVAPATE